MSPGFGVGHLGSSSCSLPLSPPLVVTPVSPMVPSTIAKSSEEREHIQLKKDHAIVIDFMTDVCTLYVLYLLGFGGEVFLHQEHCGQLHSIKVFFHNTQ